MTTIQYINHFSLLINRGKSLLLTDPLLDSKILGPPSCVHPSYLASLAEENKNNFNILISNPDHCDYEYLDLFSKDINIIIPKYKSDFTLDSPFFMRLKRLGFNNIFEITEEQEVSNIKFRTHEGGIVSIGTEDSLIIHSNKNFPFSEDCAISVNKHIQDYRARAIHLGYSGTNIILAIHAGALQNSIMLLNRLFISAINMEIKYMFFYGKLFEEFKTYESLRELIKEHLVNGIDFINMIPGDTFDFKKIDGLFNDFHYSEKTLKKNSLEFHGRNIK